MNVHVHYAGGSWTLAEGTTRAEALRFKDLLSNAFRDDGGYWLVGTDEDGCGMLQWLPAATSEITIRLDADLPPELKAAQNEAGVD